MIAWLQKAAMHGKELILLMVEPAAVLEEGGGQADTCSALLGAAEAKFCGDFPGVP